MKIYVKLDMEGITGIVSREQLMPIGPEYGASRRLLMHDLKAVLEGAFEGGCSAAVVQDAHGDGRNVDLEGLDSRVTAILGNPRLGDDYFFGAASSFGALFLVGYHARAGALEALLPHTYGDDIACMRVNDTEVGEIALEAALAGEYGVPLAFVSGDSGCVREARELLGEDVQAVEVKRAISATAAHCLPPVKTAKLLRAAAAQAVRSASRTPPVVFQSPTVLDVAFKTPRSAAALDELPNVERTGEANIRTEGQNILTAYRRFLLARQRRDIPRPLRGQA